MAADSITARVERLERAVGINCDGDCDPGACENCDMDAETTPDPDADRPCSCEEAVRLTEGLRTVLVMLQSPIHVAAVIGARDAVASLLRGK